MKYIHLAISIFKELFIEQKKKFCLFFFLSTLSVLLIPASLAGFFLVVHGWIEQKGFSLLGFDFHFSENILWSYVFITFVLLLGIFGAWISYVAKAIMIQLVVHYQQYCSLFVWGKVTLENKEWRDFFVQNPRKGLSHLMKNSISKRGQALKILLKMFMPSVIFLLTYLMMWSVHFLWSICVSIAAIFYYWSLGHLQEEDYNSIYFAKKSKKEYRNQFQEKLKSFFSGDSSVDQEEMSSLIKSKSFEEPIYLSSHPFLLKEKKQALHAAGLIFTLYMIIVLFFALYYDAQIAWKDLLLFMLALRFSSQSFQAVLGMSVKFRLLYEEANRYDRFICYIENPEQRNFVRETDNKYLQDFDEEE